METRHLDRAPISEALIDLRVKLEDVFDVTRFKDLNKLLGNDYTDPTPQQTFAAEFNFEKGGLKAAAKEPTLTGFVYQSKDSKHVAQFRKDGFSFSRLPPYTSWESVFAEAKRLWEIYIKTAAPTSVIRSALRYINRLDVPAGGTLETYLAVPPRVPEGLESKLSSFLNRIILDNVADEFTAVITQALEPSNQQAHLSILLDIDVFTHRPLEPSSQAVENVLNRIHDVKNKIFFNSITQRTAEIYQ